MKIFMKRILLIVFLFPFMSCSSPSDIVDAITGCGSLTLDNLQHLDSITDQCRSAVQSLLPENQNNFSSKLVPLGSKIDDSNRPVLYLQGIDAAGTAISSTSFSGATVTAVQGGVETTLTSSEYTITSLQDTSDDVESLSFLTDYSASMSDSDIDDAADIFDDVIAVLPAIYEAQVYDFSEIVTERQSFTETSQSVLDALVRSDAVERSSTALYDGMGTALTSLVARTRPVKILFVSTDGLENASQTFSKAQVMNLVSNNKVIVVMIGTLFSDVDELEDLAGNKGIFFYAKTYLVARTQMAAFFESLQNAVQITLDSAYQNADSVHVTVGDLSVDYSL